MIEDLEGAYPEPPRRRHVAVVSAAIAAASLALLVVLLAPPLSRHGVAPPAPAAGASSPPTLTYISNPIYNVRVDLAREIVCADGQRLTPPYFLAFGPDPGVETARPAVWTTYAVASDAWTSRSVPVAIVISSRTGSATVTCDIFAPRVDLKTIAR